MLCGFRHGEAIAAFVLRMTGVAFHPHDLNLMNVEQGEKPLPQIDVKGGGFVTLAPAVFLPRFGPALRDGVANVF